MPDQQRRRLRKSHSASIDSGVLIAATIVSCICPRGSRPASKAKDLDAHPDAVLRTSRWPALRRSGGAFGIADAA